MSGRDEILRRYLVYKAAQAALHEALKAEGRVEHEAHKMASTFRAGFATAGTSVTNDHVEITDQDALVAYIAGRYPTEVVTRTVTSVRNPAWLERLLDTWAVVGPEDDEGTIADDDGVIVPGVKWVEGGQFITVSVTPKPVAKKLIEKAVRRGATVGDWSMVEAIIQGNVDLTRPLRGGRDEDEAAG